MSQDNTSPGMVHVHKRPVHIARGFARWNVSLLRHTPEKALQKETRRVELES